MTPCEHHFDAIEAALTARGLGDLIPSPGDHHRMLRAWSKGILTLDTFDPVSMAVGFIRRVIAETAAAHPEIAETMPDCPLCWIEENQISDPELSEDLLQQDNWLLDFGVDCAVDFARKLSQPQPRNTSLQGGARKKKTS